MPDYRDQRLNYLDSLSPGESSFPLEWEEGSDNKSISLPSLTLNHGSEKQFLIESFTESN